ncbi:MAG: PAS domain-containing protein [candidate division NC10 bacterium]|nr:PAS domain-containing protein [candidate division NC10 bacterium]
MRRPPGGRQRVAELEGQLRELRAYYEDLLGSLQDGLLILDGQGGILSMNQAAEELTGLSASQTMGRVIGDAFPPLASLAAKTLAAGRSHADFDGVLLRADGACLRVSAVASVLSDAGGTSRGVVLALRDLSRVSDLEEQVRRSERLAALGILAAGIAHEVRNPLVGVRGAAQLLEKEAAFPDQLREYTQMIVRQVDRLNRIVNDLLALGAQRPLEARPCNVHQVLEEALSLSVATLKPMGLQVARQYDPEIPAAAGDFDRLLQVFLNLIRNGIEAMPGGGALTVRTRFERAAPQCGGRPAVQVEIQDRGPGIPDKVHPRLFTPFFTSKDGGTGLGLAISLRIIEEHRGAIEAQNRSGGGATFRVFLPVVTEQKE